MTTPARPDGPPAIDRTSLGARVVQVAMAVVLTIISVLLMVTTHRVSVDVAGLTLPVGLLFAAVLQVVICVFLWAASGARLPLLVVGMLWGLLATPFLGRGAGGGVLFPAQIGDQVQYSGLVVQALGILIPFIVAAVVSIGARRRARRTRP
ncbi:hypothetical protein [Brachybacterium sp. Marseille-Q7125]|uniref:hypothetical protein n=1 Tax=Brachybacterium sp. Marseille-Q7125 TaxID=2932815 RepID=UPI001FF0E2D3|nr:hypothetical protein [Brachybacterium sp. Marseille-Q7125]